MTVSAILTGQHSQRRVANEAIGGKGEGPVVGWLLEGVMREEDGGLKGACRDALHGWGLGSGLGLTTTLRDELAVVIQRGARYDAPFPVGGGVHEWGKQSGISHSMYWEEQSGISHSVFDWVYESFETAYHMVCKICCGQGLIFRVHAERGVVLLHKSTIVWCSALIRGEFGACVCMCVCMCVCAGRGVWRRRCLWTSREAGKY